MEWAGSALGSIVKSQLGTAVASRMSPVNSSETNQLKLERDSIQYWLVHVKRFIASLLDETNLMNLCHLADLIDTLNAFQLFFYNHFISPSQATKQMIAQWPEFYRTELAHGASHVERALLLVVAEIESFNRLVINHHIQPDSELHAKVTKKNDQCRVPGEWARKNYKLDDDWDVCKTCTSNLSHEYMTLNQAYCNKMRVGDTFNITKEKIQKGKSVPNPLFVSGPYKRH
jgi:hypothetical protein